MKNGLLIRFIYALAVGLITATILFFFDWFSGPINNDSFSQVDIHPLFFAIIFFVIFFAFSVILQKKRTVEVVAIIWILLLMCLIVLTSSFSLV